MSNSTLSDKENYTVVIQGLLKSDSETINNHAVLENYLKSATQIIFSYWETEETESAEVRKKIDSIQQKFEDSVIFEKNKLPNLDSLASKEIASRANCYYQFLSTLYGLKKVSTPFFIKARTDEYYSDLNPLVRKFVEENCQKLISTNVFYRASRYQAKYKFHISDHLFVQETDLGIILFEYLCNIIEEQQYNFISHIESDPKINWKFAPEMMIGCTFAFCSGVPTEQYCYNRLYLIQENIENITDNFFDCIDVNKLGDYVVKWNGSKKTYSNHIEGCERVKNNAVFR